MPSVYETMTPEQRTERARNAAIAQHKKHGNDTGAVAREVFLGRFKTAAERKRYFEELGRLSGAARRKKAGR